MRSVLISLAWLVLGIWFTQTIVRADLIYYRPDDPLPVPVSPSGAFKLDLDLDFNSIVDISLQSNGSDFDSVPQGGNEVLALIPPPPDLGTWIIPLAYGDQIDDSPSVGVWEGASTTPAFASCQDVGCIGLWLNSNHDAYFGIRFDIEGNTHYGWIHVVNTFGVTGFVTEWGYESNPNTGLLAGVIPEPSTVMLLLGGLGILALRMKQIR